MPASLWEGITSNCREGLQIKGEKGKEFQGALTSAGFTGFLPPDDEQPTSYHNCLLPALANTTRFVL